MSARQQRGFPWLLYVLAGFVILLLALAPVISVFVAFWIAEGNDCVLHEGTINPCLVNGGDVGDTLYAMLLLGWLAIASLPLGAVALLALLVVFVIHLLWWRRRRRLAV